MLFTWTWYAHFDDREPLCEIDEHGNQRGFNPENVDFEHIRAIELRPNVDGAPSHFLTVPKGARPIVFRRRQQLYRPSTGQQWDDPAQTAHFLGWQRTLARPDGRFENYQFLVAYLPGGITLVTDNRDDPLFDEILSALFPTSTPPAPAVPEERWV